MPMGLSVLSCARVWPIIPQPSVLLHNWQIIPQPGVLLHNWQIVYRTISDFQEHTCEVPFLLNDKKKSAKNSIFLSSAGKLQLGRILFLKENGGQSLQENGKKEMSFVPSDAYKEPCMFQDVYKKKKQDILL